MDARKAKYNASQRKASFVLSEGVREWVRRDSLWQTGESVNRKNEHHIYPWGLSPPSSSAVQYHGSNQHISKSRKGIDTLHGTFGGTLCSHAYKDIL